MKQKILAWILLLAALCALASPAFAARPTHGTSDAWIEEDQLNSAILSSYRVDPATQADAKDGKYNAYFLKDRLQTVSIEIDPDNLNYLLQNALEEPYVMAQRVTIGGVSVPYCGLRTKGNYTLHHAYTDNPGSDRFSFTVNFGEYIDKQRFGKKQTFFGCDKISFNNFFFDKSMMKEFFALMLMEEMGLPTPQFGLAKLYINGEYYGVYAMVEAFDKTILEQHFGVDGQELSDYLCKPTGTRLTYGELAKDPSALYENDPETYEKVESMLPVALEWARKLSCLSAGTDFAGNPIDVQSEEYLALLAQVMDVEETVTYFAVHSWLCQMDNMFVERQNFGLYISPEGVSTLLPWDYDLAFGCFYPSTAELTANYPLDVMYRLNGDLWGTESQQSQQFYKAFPLFHVIYQNDALMERYHNAMLDCSRIAALGGTAATTGKSYDPAYFQSFLEILEAPLLEAAAEPLAGHVYYMNHIQQPKDVKAALPHLSRILAQRAVGVYNQVSSIDSWVCGSGCNLENLGNGMRGDTTNAGDLTVIDPYTGIFLRGTYAGGRRSPAPVLGVTVLTEEDQAFREAQAALDLGAREKLTVYQLKSAVKSTGGYTLTIPLPAADCGEEAVQAFYVLSGEEWVALPMSREGNLFTGHLDSLGTVAVVVKTPAPAYLPWALAACGIAALAIAAAVLLRKKRRAA